MSFFAKMKGVVARAFKWALLATARLVGLAIGGLNALIASLWRYAKVPMLGAGVGAFFGASAGIVMGGGGFNAMLAFAAFGSLLGFAALMLWKQISRRPLRNKP